MSSTEERLALAIAEAGRLRAQADAYDADPEWTASGGDTAMLSGMRRKPNARADARRYARYDKGARLEAAARTAEATVRGLEARLAYEQRNRPVPFTDDEWGAAVAVRDALGWHRVVRMNAKSATVETPWSWTDRIAREKVLEVRAA